MNNLIQIILLFLFSLMGWSGAYIHEIDYIICNDPITCIHEEGHRLDRKLGYPSQTEGFKNLIDEKISIVLEDTSCIIKTEKCLYMESYAILWTVFEGNINKIPEDFRIFYRLKQ